jgi:hypothetical protein
MKWMQIRWMDGLPRCNLEKASYCINIYESIMRTVTNLFAKLNPNTSGKTQHRIKFLFSVSFIQHVRLFTCVMIDTSVKQLAILYNLNFTKVLSSSSSVALQPLSVPWPPHTGGFRNLFYTLVRTPLDE